MSLQFVFGNSGSGKSTYLYETILKEAGRNPKKNYLVIVPEQFTMQTQRELVSLQENHAIMNVDVLSFARLAYRVFDELGKENLVVLEETGKNLVLRAVAEEKKDKLRVLGKNMNKMGYVSEVKSLISELSQYNVSPEGLADFLLRSDINETLRLKMQDIQVMYQGFCDFLEGKFITSEEILSLLRDVAAESAILRDSVIVFDEFTGFTPIQNLLIQELLQIADKIMVSLTMDSREDFYHCRGEQELFAMSKKTVEVLQKMATELHVEIEEPVVLENGEEKRYKDAKALFFMEQNLFRTSYKRWKEDTKEVQLAVLKNPRQELLYVAKEIVRLVREEGYCYKDIAVVTGDVSLYANHVEEAFVPYKIPYFIDQTKNIMFHPLIEFVRATLEVIEYDFSYESVFRFLRCGLSGIDEKDIDALENYCLAKGIRGAGKWKKQWTFVKKDGICDEMSELNEVRSKVYEMFEPLMGVFSDKQATVKEKTFELCTLLEKLEVEKKLRNRKDAYEESGDLGKAKEYAQIYKIVIDLMDKIVALLGEEQISIGEYTDILDAGFEAAKVGIIPPGNDKITIGDIERTRLNHVKALFFIGVNDGVVPKAGNAGGILSQYERERMAECQLKLSPGQREKVFIQKFYLYLNMTKPSNYLYVTFSKVNAEGKALRRSYLIGTLLKMFPQKEILEPEEDLSVECLLTPESSRAFFLQGLQDFVNGEGEENKKDYELWKALTKWYLEDEHYRDEVNLLLNAAYMRHEDEPIATAVTRALYGNELTNSVTRLERFAACAFAHYLVYGLKLKEREIFEFASVDMGNIYHDALEFFAKGIEQTEYTWFDVPEDVSEALMEDSMEQAILKYQNASAFENARNRFLLERMKNTMRRTVYTLITQVKKGKFVPSDFEVSFSKASQLDAIRFTLSDEEKMQLLGRIDRVDTYEHEDKIYVKIIDYKSGNTSFSLLNMYHGLQLQLVVYLNAAMELTGKKHPDKKIEPAGIFYYHVSDPMVDGNGNETEAEVRNAVLEKLKLNGLVNEDSDVISALDSDFAGNSVVIPVGYKKDGSLTAASKVASSHDFKMMSSYVNEKIKETGKRIFAGDIAVKPYELDGKRGCDYCPYHTVCGFDTRIPGYEYDRLTKFDDAEDILAQMKAEVIKEEND